MDFIEILLLIVLWTLPPIILTKDYLKMSKKEREQFKIEVKQPSICFGIGIPAVGLLLLFSSPISGINTLGHIGATFLIISCFATAIAGLIKQEGSFLSNASLILRGLIITVVYIYWI